MKSESVITERPARDYQFKCHHRKGEGNSPSLTSSCRHNYRPCTTLTRELPYSRPFYGTFSLLLVTEPIFSAGEHASKLFHKPQVIIHWTCQDEQEGYVICIVGILYNSLAFSLKVSLVLPYLGVLQVHYLLTLIWACWGMFSLNPTPTVSPEFTIDCTSVLECCILRATITTLL